ncbi:MAG: hypothetical protein PHS46_07850 [Candidatus Omnitrophica bacterium]|nr:hypothetical protein [Candidatus Omnitrophota bacterium]
MRVGDIVLTPGEGGPYQGKYALVIGTAQKSAVVHTGLFELTYLKEDIKVVGKIKTGKTYKPGRGPDANRFQQFCIIIGDRIKTVDVIISNSCYKLGDLRKAAWAANAERFACKIS